MHSDNLTYSEITTLAGKLKMYTGQIEELLTILKNEDYSLIGSGSDVWTGDLADRNRDLFNDLFAEFPEFVKTMNTFADYLVNVVAQR